MIWVWVWVWKLVWVRTWHVMGRGLSGCVDVCRSGGEGVCIANTVLPLTPHNYPVLLGSKNKR